MFIQIYFAYLLESSCLEINTVFTWPAKIAKILNISKWSDCQTECLKNDICKFWSVNFNRICYLATSDSGRQTGYPGYMAGPKVCPGRGFPEFPCLENNIDLSGNDIRYVPNTRSWIKCRNHCKNEVNCKYWSLTHHGICRLKTSDSGRRWYPGSTSGSKHCAGWFKYIGCLISFA